MLDIPPTLEFSEEGGRGSEPQWRIPLVGVKRAILPAATDELDDKDGSTPES